MIRIRFDIPAYERALADLIGDVAQGLLNHDGLLAHIPVRQTVHSGPNRNVRSPQPLDVPLGTVEHIISIPLEVIRNTNIDAFTRILYEFAEAHRNQIARSMIQTIMDVTNATGNTVNAQGQPLTFDMINDMLEKIELGVDEQGRPIPPMLVAHPDIAQRLAAIQPTPDQLERYAEILRRKQAEYHAQKRTRRLS